jgi:hypothetical protein
MTPCYATITDSHAPNETITPSSTRHAGANPLDNQIHLIQGGTCGYRAGWYLTLLWADDWVWR